MVHPNKQQSRQAGRTAQVIARQEGRQIERYYGETGRQTGSKIQADKQAVRDRQTSRQ